TPHLFNTAVQEDKYYVCGLQGHILLATPKAGQLADLPHLVDLLCNYNATKLALLPTVAAPIAAPATIPITPAMALGTTASHYMKAVKVPQLSIKGQAVTAKDLKTYQAQVYTYFEARTCRPRCPVPAGYSELLVEFEQEFGDLLGAAKAHDAIACLWQNGRPTMDVLCEFDRLAVRIPFLSHDEYIYFVTCTFPGRILEALHAADLEVGGT
ncbi:hypothetical protein GGF32_008415, partial [Allomyces javanicus]